ncbi:MAG: DNA polymerase III subunit beta, partial [bacterium]
YPQLPEVPADLRFTIRKDQLLYLLEKALPFVSTDELRPQLTGVQVEISPDSIRFVATDGHRLSCHTVSETGVNAETHFIMPADFGKTVLKAIKSKAYKNLIFVEGSVTLTSPAKPDDERSVCQVCFIIGSQTFIGRPIEGRYPTYEAVIPKANENKLVCNREQLVEVVSRVRGFSSEISQQLRFTLNGTCTIDAEDVESGGQASEIFAGEYIGDDLTIGFNAGYVLSALAALKSGRVEWGFGSPTSASILRAAEDERDPNDDFLVLLMPVRLN